MADARPTVAEPGEACPNHEPAAAPEWRAGDVVLDTYEIRQVFAGGGMGLVYHVRHRGWNLDLAVKRPRPEFFRTDAQRADFEREAEAWVGLGLHPHVATCHYVRRIDRIPCVFAEFAPGGSLADRLRAGPLSLPAALDAAVQIAWGLDVAHARGLVHQDVKPANLLVAEAVADTPTVKVTDFGLAAARGVVSLAQSEPGSGRTLAVAGAGAYTPEYAAPEQFAGEPVTRRTDVWGWAVTVLELLTARRPAVGHAAPDLLQLVNHSAWPAGLFELLRESLEVDPELRPRDMGAVAARLCEVYRRLSGADYPRRTPRLARLDLDAKNNRAVSLADLGKPDAAEALWAEVLRADRGHPEAVYNLGLARWRAGRLSLDWLLRDLREVAAGDPRPAALVGRLHLEAGDPAAAAEAVAHRPAADDVATEASARQAVAPVLAWRVTAHPDGVRALACGGGRVVTAGADRTVRVWDHDGRPVREFAGHRSTPETVVVSDDGRFVLSAAPQEGGAPAELTLWDVESGRCVWHVEAANPSGPDSRNLATFPAVAVAVGRADAVSFTHGRLDRRDHKGRVVESAEGTGFHAVAGGDVIVSESGDGIARALHVWDRDTLALRRTIPVPDFVDELEVQPNGAVATGRVDGRRRFWDLATGAELPPPCPWPRPFAARAGGPLDDQLVRVTLSVAATGAPVFAFTPHPGELRPHVAVADGLLFTAAGYGDGAGELAAWRLDPAMAPYTAPPALCVAQPTEQVIAAEADVDAHLDATRASRDRGDWAATARHVRAARAVPGAARRRDAFAAWSELAPHLARGPFRGGWEADTFETGAGGRALALAPDGRRLVTPCPGGFRLWDADTAAPLADLPTAVGGPRDVVIAAGGEFVVTATDGVGIGGEVTAWDAAGRPRWTNVLPSQTAGVTSLALSGDGRFVLTAHGDWTAALWDAATGRRIRAYSQRFGGLSAVAVGPAAEWFLAVDYVGAVRVWDAATGRCRRTLDVRNRAAAAVAVTADGRFALVGCADRSRVPYMKVAAPRGDGGLALVGIVRIHTPDDVLAANRGGPDGPADGPEHLRLFDLATGRVVREFDARAGVATIAVSPDGRLAVTGDDDHAVRVWDVTAGTCLRAFPGHREAVERVALCGDPFRAASADRAGWVKVWALDWEYDDRPPSDPPRTVPVVFGPEEFEPPRLIVRGDDPPAETAVAAITAADRDDRPVVLPVPKLVWKDGGLYRGDPDGPHELLHARDDIVAVELEYPHRWLTPVCLVGGAGLAAAVYLLAPADWGWKLAVTLAALTPFGLVAWFLPTLVVRTRAGESRYEIMETGSAPRDFAASVALTLPAPEADR